MWGPWQFGHALVRYGFALTEPAHLRCAVTILPRFGSDKRGEIITDLTGTPKRYGIWNRWSHILICYTLVHFHANNSVNKCKLRWSILYGRLWLPNVFICICVYKSIYTCTYICEYMCVYIYIYVCVYKYICIYITGCQSQGRALNIMNVYNYTHIYVYINIHHIYIHVYIYIYLCMYMYIYIQTYERKTFTHKYPMANSQGRNRNGRSVYKMICMWMCTYIHIYLCMHTYISV